MGAVILPKGTGVTGKAKAVSRNEEQLSGPCFNITNPTDTTEAFEVLEADVNGVSEWCLLIPYNEGLDYRLCFTQSEQDEMINYNG